MRGDGNLNTRLKGYRVMAGFTQEDMAKILGVHRPYYTLKENGNKFTREQKVVILKLLKKKIPNLTMEELFPIDEG